MFKVVIAGGRDFSDYDLLKKWCDYYLEKRIQSGEQIVIISGGARGADTLGEQYATEKGFTVDKHPADWNKNGKAAGYIRNKEMVDIADAVIAFWDGKSKGTSHTINLAESKGIPCKVINY